MQEPCKRSAGLCRETARGLQEACGGLQGIFTALQLAYRGTAGTLPDNCKGGPKGNLQGNCKGTVSLRRPCLQGIFNALQRACRGTAGKLQANCKEDPNGICKGNAQNLQEPAEEPAREVQGNCKGTRRESPGDVRENRWKPEGGLE